MQVVTFKDKEQKSQFKKHSNRYKEMNEIYQSKSTVAL